MELKTKYGEDSVKEQITRWFDSDDMCMGNSCKVQPDKLFCGLQLAYNILAFQL